MNYFTSVSLPFYSKGNRCNWKFVKLKVGRMKPLVWCPTETAKTREGGGRERKHSSPKHNWDFKLHCDLHNMISYKLFCEAYAQKWPKIIFKEINFLYSRSRGLVPSNVAGLQIPFSWLTGQAGWGWQSPKTGGYWLEVLQSQLLPCCHHSSKAN